MGNWLTAIRDAATGIALFLFVAVVSGFVSSNVRVLASDRGWDQFLLTLWRRIEAWPQAVALLAMISNIRNIWWLWLSLGLSSGVSIALWIEPTIAPQGYQQSQLGGTATPKATSSAELVAGSPFGPTVHTEGGPVGWVLDSQFLVTSYGNSGDEINSVILQGKSRVTVGFKEAFAVSGFTGHRQPILIDVPYKGAFQVSKVDIPPQADVQLEMTWSPPLVVRDFLDQWGKFRVVIAYDDGTTWEHEFDEAYVKDRLNRQIPSALGPRVTLKDAK